MNETNATQAAGSSAPACSACGFWRWRVACIGSHVAKRYGLQLIDKTHGGQAVHYGWPRRSVGVEWSWGHNTWFYGWELWSNSEIVTKQEDKQMKIQGTLNGIKIDNE